jgi:acyl carrier protein
MKKTEFIQGLEEQLELEFSLNETTNLKELEEWDSLNAMVLISYVSETTGVNLTGNDVSEITTVKSLLDRIGYNLFK